MSDQHLVNSIIASAILDARKDHQKGEWTPRRPNKLRNA